MKLIGMTATIYETEYDGRKAIRWDSIPGWNNDGRCKNSQMGEYDIV